MYRIQRKLLSQNFLHSRKLVKKLVDRSSIGKNDLVLEIGPGKGIITESLVEKAQTVLAIELDTHWYSYLHHKFMNMDNLILYHDDFLDRRLPHMPYKVFANIPFSIEGEIIRKLIDDPNPPTDCYLIMLKELAYRLAAPYKENLFSITHKPWFNFSIFHHFSPTDFEPIPKVSIVMLRFTEKENPLLPIKDKEHFQKFVTRGFGQGLPVMRNLQRYIQKGIVHKGFQKLSIARDTKPSSLSLQKWIALYLYLCIDT